jgi:alpha-D-ribose 1-methylphosphonate 5-triphosphate synthase subunit PhnH
MQDPTQHHSKGQNSIEQLNRDTFRACIEALARPGRPQRIQPLFDSHLLAMASSLLYSKILYCYQGRRTDFHLVEAMTGATSAPPEASHYLFADSPSIGLWRQAGTGSMEKPETSATCIFDCSGTDETGVILRGPGIKDALRTHLPVAECFALAILEDRPPFPQGVDLFLLDGPGRLIGLPRTTAIEVLR